MHILLRNAGPASLGATAASLALVFALTLLSSSAALQGCAPTPGSRKPCVDEVCGDELDNDCDGQIDEEDAVDRIVWFIDADRDDYGNPNIYVEGCARPIGYVDQGGDCLDGDANAYPGAEEICDGLDNNCDGATDLDDATGARTFYADVDDDGYGDKNAPIDACERPPGYVSDDTDCDDEREDVYPSASEFCDGEDNDCDKLTDEIGAVDPATWYRDADEDGYGDPEDSVEQCNAPTGYIEDSDDCNDADETINRDALEICDEIDNDCDDMIDMDDADLSGALSCFTDEDSDGYGLSKTKITACECPKGTVAMPGDCDDTNADISPGDAEICGDAIDSDCDGTPDEKDPDCVDG